MTKAELIATIQDIENGLAMNPTGEILERLTNRLARAKAKLAELSQKKSVEPSANLGQLPQKPELEDWAKQIEAEQVQKNKRQEQSAKAFEKIRELSGSYQGETRVSVGRACEITVIVPVAEVKIGDNVRSLTQNEIVGYLKTYFKRVATGDKMKAGQYTNAYASEMGKTVWRLFDGWNLIYQQTQEGSEWPPMVDIFPGWKNAQQAHKITADVLWRWASTRKE